MYITWNKEISNLLHQKGAKQGIIADIYSCRYGAVQKYGLEDSTDPGDFQAKLKSLQDKWDRPYPGFHKSFWEKQKPIFVQGVIETTRSGTTAQGSSYSNNIERQHFR